MEDPNNHVQMIKATTPSTRVLRTRVSPKESPPAVSTGSTRPRRAVTLAAAAAAARNDRPHHSPNPPLPPRPRAKTKSLLKKKKTRIVPRRTTLPQYLTCPETQQTVWIVPATRPDVQLAQKQQRPPWVRQRQYLVTIPHPPLRQELYQPLTKIWQYLEQARLPTYGGRPWQVQVKIQDASTTTTTTAASCPTTPRSQGHHPKAATGKKIGSPYFCWQPNGQLALAVWPELLARLPPPPRFPGFTSLSSTTTTARSTTTTTTKSSNRNKKKKMSKTKRKEPLRSKDADEPIEESSSWPSSCPVDVVARLGSAVMDEEETKTHQDPVEALFSRPEGSGSTTMPLEKDESNESQRLPPAPENPPAPLPSDSATEEGFSSPSQEEPSLTATPWPEPVMASPVVELEQVIMDEEGQALVAEAPKERNLQEENEEEDNDDDEEEEEEEDEEEDDGLDDEERDLLQRPSTPLSRLAYEERWRVPLPVVTIKWISPLHQIYHSRKSANEHAVALCRQEVYLDRFLSGMGAHGRPVKITWPSKKETLKAGKLRFDRDGLWVVGQEESWQRKRLEEQGYEVVVNEISALASSTKSRAQRPGKGVHVTEAPATPSHQVVTKEGESETNQTGKRGLSGLAYYLQCNRRTHREKRLEELRLSCMQPDQPSQDDVMSSKTSAVAVVSEESSGHSSETEASGDIPSSGLPRSYASTPLPAHVEMAADISTISSTPCAVESSASSTAMVDEAGGDKLNVADAVNLPCVSNQAVVSPPKTGFNRTSKVSFTLLDAEKELRSLWKSLSKEEIMEWKRRAKEIQHEMSCRKSDKLAGNQTVVESTPSSLDRTNHVAKTSRVKELEPVPVVSPCAEGKSPVISGKSVFHSPCPLVPPCAESERKRKRALLSPSATAVENLEHSEIVHSDSNHLGSCRADSVPKEKLIVKKPGPSQTWCLNKAQIAQCYEAGMDHYDQVIRTVQARDLSRELQDGFDVLRERGRGRFDMELPAFDGSDFSFLTDLKKAPWMPVVREILGKDVVLIHKGMFLALEGAEAQVYHQDGVHLATHYQRPCHAINVFVPLVDLTLQHGPTEFCLGSHILGQEGYDKNFLDVPLVSAGTPIIFDYRLGHRGLANTSSECRPIVYCTYAAAADGKEFRDSVNFSRKRYHRIGDLVSTVPTREERAQKRSRLAN